MDFSNPYLKEQIIAYIGNKRRLLPLIYQAIEDSKIKIKPGLKFLDLFAGSGVVSRLAKFLDFELYSNDWEPYAYIVNSGFLETSPSDIPQLFDDWNSLIDTINNLSDPSPEDCYISRYYSSSHNDIDKADFTKERLFYTRENGLAIDKIRNYIEQHYSEEQDLSQRNLLLSLLLYQAATHTNTSGIFKACHKGFGGHGKDALKRITGPIRLQNPTLIESLYPVHISMKDANQLVREPAFKGLDIAYLDPPYNQHQYGSNYHLLNTISLWDKNPEPLDLNEMGFLKKKAAIREDWIKTRSPYCYKEKAITAFKDLLEHLDAKIILISYSTDGIIPFETMKKICSKRGKLSITTGEYTKYRGGKQSNQRLNTNIEFVLSIDTKKPSTLKGEKAIDEVILKRTLLLLFRQNFSSIRLKNHGAKIINNYDINKDNLKYKTHNKNNAKHSDIVISLKSRKIVLPSLYGYQLIPTVEIETLSTQEKQELLDLLSECIFKTKEEELEEIIRQLDGTSQKDIFLVQKLPKILRKLAHKKHREIFEARLKQVKTIRESFPELYKKIGKKVIEIEEIAEKRFQG